MSDLTACRQLSFDEGSMDESERNEQTDAENLCNNDNSRGGLSLLREELVPKIAMEFETETDAYEFYLAYARKLGFGVRKSIFHNDKSGKLRDRIFCCSAEGRRGKNKSIGTASTRAETRFGCEAKMKISIQRDGKLRVIKFVEGHNHDLTSPAKTHLYRSHRKISSVAAMQIEMASGVGIRPKASYDLMAKELGGRDMQFKLMKTI